MTDFFAELEGHLHEAARRRARRPRPGILLAVAATAASVALVFAGLARIDTGDPEVAAPVPAATATAPGSSCEEPPQAVLNRFAVLRRAPTDADRAPDEVLRRVDQDFPGVGRPARIWPEAGRLARTLGDDDHRSPGEYTDVWLFPVVLDGCRPAVCWVSVDPKTSLAYCHPLEEVTRPISLVTDEGRVPSVSALVPDGRRAIGVNARARVEGTTEGNVFFARGATEIEELAPEIDAGCAAPGTTAEAPAPEVLDLLPGLRDGPLRLAGETWRKALAGPRLVAHVHHARTFHTGGALDVFGVVYSPLPADCRLPGDPVEDGACLVAVPQQSEYFAHCFNRTRIAEGRALVHDAAAGLAYTLVPAGTREVTLGGAPMEIEGSFAHRRTAEARGRLQFHP